MYSITPETAKIGSSYSHMRGVSFIRFNTVQLDRVGEYIGDNIHSRSLAPSPQQQLSFLGDKNVSRKFVISMH